MTITKALTGLIGTTIESFETKKENNNVSYSKYLAVILASLRILLIIAFCGKFLWNEFIAGAGKGNGVITVLKPVDNVWRVIVVYITIGLFFGRV